MLRNKMPTLTAGDRRPEGNRRTAVPECIHVGLGWIGDQGGGLERYQDGICRAHSKLGVNATAWVQSRTSIELGLPYRVVAYASLEDSRRTRIRALQDLAQERLALESCLVISHHASVSASLLDVIADKPHVVHFHGPWAEEASIEGAPWWKTVVQRRSEKLVYRNADCVITLSNAFREIAINQYGVRPNRIRVIPGGIDVQSANADVSRREAREKLGWPTDRPIVVTVRRLVRRVGVDVLIGAIARIVDRHPDVLLMVGGSGPMKTELEAQIDQLGIGENVRLLGFIPEEDLPLAYCAGDFSVVPTQHLEGFGLVVIESLATGTPAIVTPVGSLPEVVGDLSDSLIARGKSETDLAERIGDILDGQVILPNREQCREYAEREFDWSNIGPRVLEVYRSSL